MNATRGKTPLPLQEEEPHLLFYAVSSAQRRGSIENRKIIRNVAKIGIAALLASAMFSNTLTPANADNNSGKFTTGKVDLLVQANNTGAMESAKSAVLQWNGISKNVVLTYKASSTKPRIFLSHFLINPPSPGDLGVAFYYRNSSAVSNSSTWDESRVFVYKNTAFTSSTAVAALATATHEVGHALSRGHCTHSGQDHIMHQGLKTFKTISTYDKNELISKWGA